MRKQWFVVHTLTGKENKVKTSIEKMAEAKDLTHLLGRILVPTETEVRAAAGQRREVKRKLYPGYVIIEATPTVEVRQLILQTNGVTHFVGSSDDPVPLTQARGLEGVGHLTGVGRDVPVAGHALGCCVVPGQGERR